MEVVCMPLTGTEKYQSRILRSVFSSGHEIRNRELVDSEKGPSPSRANTVRLDMNFSLGARAPRNMLYTRMDLSGFGSAYLLGIPTMDYLHSMLTRYVFFTDYIPVRRAQFVLVALNLLRQMIFTAP